MPITAAEIFLRSVGLGDPILFYTNQTYRMAPQPDQKTERLKGAKVTIDSKGLRSERDWTSPADAKILFIGDSITWGGTYIDDKDTFAQRVCARLEAVTNKTFVCGNAGVNGYGTDNMAERVRHKNVDDETILVVTLISHDALRGMADITRGFFYTRQPPKPFKAVWEAAGYVIWRVSGYLFPIRGPNRGKPERQVAEQSLEGLFSAIRETDRHGRQVLFVLSPFKPELAGPESNLTKQVRAILQRSGFDFIDFHSEYDAALSDGFFYDDAHLDVLGHKFYAERIAERLEKYFVDSASKK